jgi:tetratricopeptide (TPR) repeat protein
MGAPATPSSGGVFISYRRQETAPYARSLHDELRRRLGSQQVFMDVDSIEVGVDFAEAIQRAVDACQVLLALIGSQWLTIADANGQRRLDNPDDTVRLEIEAALARNTRVIPVLVDNTPMPDGRQLPESLAPLTRRNALDLSYNRYAHDLERLVEAVGNVIGRTAAPTTSGGAASELPAMGDLQVGEVKTLAAGAITDDRLLSRAKAFNDLRRYEEALQDLNRALELDPNNTQALATRGNTYLLIERNEEALQVLNRALQLDPNNTQTLGLRGDTYRKMKRYEQALQDFTRGLQLDPNNTTVLARRKLLPWRFRLRR